MKQKSGPEKAPAEQVVKDIRQATRRQFSAEEKIRIEEEVCAIFESRRMMRAWFLLMLVVADD